MNRRSFSAVMVLIFAVGMRISYHLNGLWAVNIMGFAGVIYFLALIYGKILDDEEEKSRKSEDNFNESTQRKKRGTS